MTHSPDPGATGPAASSVRLPSFMDGDETHVAPHSDSGSLLPALGLPGYEFLREIHRGGQGVVYEALQKATHRGVAIKVMKEGPFAGPDDKARFDREVRILARLKHPNIVTIHDSGTAAGCNYFVMDYVAGESLGDYLGLKPRPISELVEMFRRICAAVEAAHAHGVVHRDLKPGNIRIDANGEPYILDFGLAKMPGSVLEPSHVTQTGFFVGSLPWAAPEQAEGRVNELDARTDVYSLGVVFYFMLTGRFPYDIDGSVPEVIERITHAIPARPSAVRREIDSELSTIVLKCLQKEPVRRYASAGAIAADLAAYQAGRPITAKRDSIFYVLSKSGRRLAGRHLITSYLAVVLGVTIAVHALGYPLFFTWTPAHRAFERLLARFAAPPSAAPNLDYVRVIALTDETDPARLAQSAGLRGVSTQDNKSLRRLHGRLMEKLTGAGCRALVWDITFASQTEFDEDFVRGARAMRAAGVDVIVGVGRWWLDNPSAPELSPVIAPEVRWGSIVAGLSEKLPWRVQLVAQRGLDDPLPSLALAAYAAATAPGKQYDIRFDRGESLDLVYWTPEPAIAQKKRRDGRTSHIELGLAREGESATGAFAPATGLRVGDRVGIFLADAPADEVLKAATLLYHDVFTSAPDQARTWLAGKVALLADLRGGKDRFRTPDGRLLPGCYAHAAAINALLANESLRMPRWLDEWIIPFLGAIVGATAMLLIARAPARLLSLVGCSAACLVLSVIAYRFNRYVVNALIPMLSLWLAAALIVAVRRWTAGPVRVQ